jgi:signal transduction histidine kinase
LKTLLKRKDIYISVFLVTAILITWFVFTLRDEFYNSALNDYGYEILNKERYTDSVKYEGFNYSMANWLDQLAGYQSEEFIIQGGTVTKDKLLQAKENLFQGKRQNLDLRLNQYERGRVFLSGQVTENASEPPRLAIPGGNYGNYDREAFSWLIFEEEYADEINNLSAEIVKEDLARYRSLRDMVNDEVAARSIIYYVTRGSNVVLSNTAETSKDFFESTPYHFSREGSLNKIYLAYYPDTFLAEKNQEWAEARGQVIKETRKLSLLLLAVIIGALYLIWGAGKKEDNGGDAFRTEKLLYNEIIAAGMAVLLAIAAAIMINFEGRWDNTGYMVLIVAWELILTALILAGGLLVVKRLKNRTFLKNTLFFVIIVKFFSWAANIYRGGSLTRKAVAAVVIAGLITMIPMAGIITIPLAVWLICKLTLQCDLVLEGAEEIKAGDYSKKIEIKGRGELARLAGNLNQIADGLNTEVERRMKSERLKTELISNVSHDIRTPLTSVITYVDLLKKEGLENEKAANYVDIIDRKSSRLKILIDDLFEASKITSGNMPAALAKVDLNALLKQGLGELNDRIRESELDFKINIPSEKIFVKADGKMFWRVIENILSNVFKYSLPNSRVYIDVKPDENRVIMEIKNISAYELNVDEEELLERFKRGDESRNSEGSGLGLSIAKSLMDSQNGSLAVKIDGDLFKATITIPRYVD